MATAANRRERPTGSPKDPKGLYATLGVGADASVDELRRAYRRLALRWHPDKNPDDPSATEQFQQISSAYEVLSDPERREMYNATGCVDAEELEETDLFRAEDLFAAFFRGAGGFDDEDMDAEEQAMMDEILRLAGGNPFKRKGGRGGRKKGRSAAARRAEERRINEAFRAAMASVESDQPLPSCPHGHALKRRKADADYECDVCESDIVEGKRFFDCRKCDYSMCQKCYKAVEAMKAEAEQEEGEEDGNGLSPPDPSELLDAFVEHHTRPVRNGSRLCTKCEICGATLATQEAVLEHMEDRHRDKIEAFVEEALEARFGDASSGPPGGLGDLFGGLEELMMADLLFGGGGGASSGGGRGGGGKGPRRSKKRR